MTPLKERPFSWSEESLKARHKKMEEEIKEFVASGAEYAEVWQDPVITPSRNVHIYKRVALKLKQYDVNFRQSKFRVIIYREVKR